MALGAAARTAIRFLDPKQLSAHQLMMHSILSTNAWKGRGFQLGSVEDSVRRRSIRTGWSVGLFTGNTVLCAAKVFHEWGRMVGARTLGPHCCPLP